MTPPDDCPLCGRRLIEAHWISEYSQFLFTCPSCTTFTIPPELDKSFGTEFRGDPDIPRLSRYLREAGEDDNREITVESWRTV